MLRWLFVVCFPFVCFLGCSDDSNALSEPSDATELADSPDMQMSPDGDLSLPDAEPPDVAETDAEIDTPTPDVSEDAPPPDMPSDIEPPLPTFPSLPPRAERPDRREHGDREGPGVGGVRGARPDDLLVRWLRQVEPRARPRRVQRLPSVEGSRPVWRSRAPSALPGTPRGR